ncbi:FAD-dependent oxidoreductase (plasmid) [Nostoc sp. UHCC 0926]|uniref:NAD(P)/FAD-dependent oxidoreductase n=1 Tax=Nostoc sp. UHCC 0926 TaxID=3025190 RepID=UPI0023623C84|nr:FAD-dependent oxidoreductase [Nostoc sp. UHCC 0926]WDD30113.1 FAD-dependent oxidoreductase [Nostoc sp. UHCC 0926]
MKVSVVGAGIIGLSAAWALQRNGHQVTVYEQGEIPNSLGSSVDQHRLIRFPYGDELGYTHMVSNAYQAWEQLWEDIGTSLYVQTGTLVLAGSSSNEDWAYSSARTLEKLGFLVDWLDRDRLKYNFPLFSFDSGERGFYLNSGGVLLAQPIIEKLSQYLTHQGVVLHPNSPIDEVDTTCAQIVLANKKVVDADILIIAAGPWVRRLLPAFYERVIPSRQVIVYIEPPAFLASRWTTAPMVLDVAPFNNFYLVPSVMGTQIKIGSNSFSMSGEPDYERLPSESEAIATYKLCQHRLKDFQEYSLIDAKTCFYSVAPEKHFIVESIGSSWILSGFSGHGFKFGPLLGLALADAIADRFNKDELNRWAAGYQLTENINIKV